MRQNFSVDKQITFNNSDTLTQQYTVYGENIASNSDGKKLIKSGSILCKDSLGKVKPLSRYNPTTNTVVGTTGTITLKDVTGISINDKVDLLFRSYIVTFASGSGTVTFTLGSSSFTFTLDATPAVSITNFIQSYNSSPSSQYSVKALNSTKLLISIKYGTDVPSFSPATGITLAAVNTTNSISGTLGTVTAVNPITKTITYTAVGAFTDCALGVTTIQIGASGTIISSVLGFVTKDYDFTNHTTKIIPVLTASNGVYKSRIAYFDQDLVTRFPKIEFI